MVTYTMMREFVPPELLEEAFDENFEPYHWNLLLSDYIRMCCMTGTRVEGVCPETLKDVPLIDQLYGSAVSTLRMLNDYPIYYIDKSLEVLIEDTRPDYNNIFVPFPCIFINKRFQIGDSVVMGFFIQNMESYLYVSLLQSGRSKKEAKISLEEIRNSEGINGKFPQISITYVIIEPEKMVLTITDEEDLNYDFGKNGLTKHTIKMTERVMTYALNICSLLNSHANLKNPVDTSKDIRIVPHNPRNVSSNSLKLSNNKPRFSYVRVFGDLGKYVKGYVKDRRKYTRNLDSWLVRGHFRTYKAERYKNMLGETVWIMPYFKGNNNELYQKLVKMK